MIDWILEKNDKFKTQQTKVRMEHECLLKETQDLTKQLLGEKSIRADQYKLADDLLEHVNGFLAQMKAT